MKEANENEKSVQNKKVVCQMELVKSELTLLSIVHGQKHRLPQTTCSQCCLKGAQLGSVCQDGDYTLPTRIRRLYNLMDICVHSHRFWLRGNLFLGLCLCGE